MCREKENERERKREREDEKEREMKKMGKKYEVYSGNVQKSEFYFAETVN